MSIYTVIYQIRRKFIEDVREICQIPKFPKLKWSELHQGSHRFPLSEHPSIENFNSDLSNS